jgi:hypothetical protein
MAEKSLQNLLKKKEEFAMKVTTKICGSTKELFVQDCINKECLETNAAKSIFDIYYQIIPQIPNYEFMEFVEIKKYITDHIKFK